MSGSAGTRPGLRNPQGQKIITRYRAVQPLASGGSCPQTGGQAGGLIPCREVSSNSGRPAPGARATAGGELPAPVRTGADTPSRWRTSTGCRQGGQPARSQVPPAEVDQPPGTGRFSHWRTAGSRERLLGRWPDPVPVCQQRQRETDSRCQGNGRQWNRQRRRNLWLIPRTVADQHPVQSGSVSSNVVQFIRSSLLCFSVFICGSSQGFRVDPYSHFIKHPKK